MPRILVVDDSLTDRRLAGGLLARIEHCDVHYATDGQDGLEQVELHLPDLVLTDLNMPNLDGLELVKQVRERYPLIPVILMTAQGSEAIAVEALRRGASSYVPKARLADELVDTVQQVLKVSQADRGRARLMRRLRHQHVEFAVENDQELIASLLQYLQEAARGMALCDESERIRLGVALQEAMTNACYHGNLEVSSELREIDHRAYYELARERMRLPPFSTRRIFVSATFSPEQAVYVIRDEGPGFDPGGLPDPRDPQNLEKASGRGLLLMQTFMDELRFNDRGNEVTLIKRCSLPPSSAPSVEESP